MKLKIKKENSNGKIKIESKTEVKDVFVNPEITNAKKENIAIAFKSNSDSGFIELTKNEVNLIIKKLNEKRHLIN
jgi:hypothetical protein